MNMLQILFGRRVGVRCAQPAENAPGPKGRNASIHGLTPLASLRENARTDADLAALRENPDFTELTQPPDARMRRGDSLQAQSILNARTL